MATTARGTAIHNDVGVGLASPASGNKRVLLSALAAKGVLTAAGSYAAGKAQADVEKLLAVPDPVTVIMNDAAKVAYGV